MYLEFFLIGSIVGWILDIATVKYLIHLAGNEHLFYSGKYNRMQFILLPQFILGKRTLDCINRMTVFFPVFEISMGVILLLSVHQLQTPIHILANMIFISMLVVIAMINVHPSARTIIPDTLTIPGIFIGFF